MGLGDTFHFYEYLDDKGLSWGLKLSSAVAVQGSFGVVVDPRAVNIWPFGPKNIRHVWGKTADGKRTRLPVSSLTNSLYVNGGTFTLGGDTYSVQGAIGEAKKLNNLA